MSAEINDDEFGAVLTQNFDTYTLILQLGCILNTVPAWKKSYQLRVAVFVEYETDVQEESDRVKKLLENLRIQAEVLVVWLANGSLRTYEVIVNGADPGSDMYVEQMLGKEKWWKELKQRRKPPAIPGRPVHIDGLSQLVEHVWPNSSFLQLGRSENAPVRFGRGLKKIFGKTKRHRSLSGLRGVPTFRTQRLDPDTLIHHGSASEPEASSDEESVVSSVASDTYARDSSDPENDEFGFRRRRRASTGNALTGYWCPTAGAPGIRELSTVTGINPCIENEPNLLAPPTSHLEVRPRTVSRESTPSFSCKAIPDTRLSTTDGPGPSIMFADDPALHLGNKSKKHGSASASSAIVTASGNMRQKAVVQEALSFNDLPSHGQHLILNELMKQHSVDTAVLFTTLPSPPAASCKSETASMEYLRGLEVCFLKKKPLF
jgi:potassium/chloride transporter 9